MILILVIFIYYFFILFVMEFVDCCWISLFVGALNVYRDNRERKKLEGNVRDSERRKNLARLMGNLEREVEVDLEEDRFLRLLDKKKYDSCFGKGMLLAGGLGLVAYTLQQYGMFDYNPN